ncbi:LysE family translocator [Leucothrix arctica]|uniref:Lysine transporter LysE n=1 Tax=Leucothrix arctica TaxID=1481894 RepID=A0A317CFT6_9GAMM|nr:LysE family translocator [Leucothrix arctica]PWQ96981.1 lysine transporter LysE [Leucothrix arctica]
MISIELILATTLFALITSITPGPNNIMLTASGANFGFKRTLPHVAGIICGMMLLNISVGVGLGTLFTQFPVVQQVLRVAGSAYLLYLAYKLLSFSSLGKVEDNAKPFSLLEATAFQAINPKAWIMVISANASFSLTGDLYWWSVAMIVTLYAIIGTPSIMLWAGFGQFMRRFLGQPTILRVFNITMATLTALCVFFIWMD